MAASGEDFGVFAGPGASFDARLGGSGVRGESLFFGCRRPPEEVFSAIG
jgi:hypothetical protein